MPPEPGQGDRDRPPSRDRHVGQDGARPAEGRGGRPRPTPARRRLAAALWLVFALVAWNVLFDAAVKDGVSDYLNRQALHQQGRGPAVGIFDVMRPAVSRGALVASAWALPIAVVGVVGAYLGARR